MTRITQLSMTTSTLAGLQLNLARTQKLQEDVSSGKRILVPSDDPAGAVSSIRMRTEQSASDQYLRNGEFANSRLNVADTALQSLSSQLQQVQQLALRSRNGSLNSGGREALAQQVSALKSQVVGTYNSQYLGRPVFGGTTAGQVAIATDGSYVGDGNPVMARISSSSSVRVDVDGASVGADTVPALIDRVAINIADGTLTDDDLNDLSAVLNAYGVAVSNVGATANQIKAIGDQVSAYQLGLVTSIAKNEDADLAETLTKLSSQEVAYQAALSVTAKVNQISLLDYLR
jgi:flagellar hook-associated protein 3 FlgL